MVPKFVTAVQGRIEHKTHPEKKKQAKSKGKTKQKNKRTHKKQTNKKKRATQGLNEAEEVPFIQLSVNLSVFAVTLGYTQSELFGRIQIDR